MTWQSVLCCAGCVIICHVLAWRANNVLHWSRWLALAALLSLTWQAWPAKSNKQIDSFDSIAKTVILKAKEIDRGKQSDRSVAVTHR